MSTLKFSSKTNTFFSYFLVIFIIFLTDNPIISENKKLKVVLLIILFISFVVKKQKLDSTLLKVILVSTILIALQGIFWNFNLFTLITFTLLSIVSPYFIYKILGFRFFKLAENVIYFFSITSLIFYFGELFIPQFTDLLNQVEILFRTISSLPERPSILIYTLASNRIDYGELSDILRNYGIFHEPGAFAVFIVFAFSLNLIINEKILTKKNLIYLIALITTFSTAGYISLFLVLFTYFFIKSKRSVILSISGFLILIFAILFVNKLPFMGNKIEKQYEEQKKEKLTTETSGRILGARKALVVLSKYPFTGRGLIQASRVNDFKSEEAAGYGLITFLSQIGVFFSLIFLFYFYRGFKILGFYFSGSPISGIIIVSGIAVNLSSQSFFPSYFFTPILFMGFENIKKLKLQS